MPIQYQGILAEHEHTRKAVSIFDICHMGEFLLDADAIASGFDRIVTQNIISMPEGSCRYGFMLNENGGILDDLVVYRQGKTKWILVVNAATTRGDFENLKKNLVGKYGLEDISSKTAKLDIQGPLSLEALGKIFGRQLDNLKFYTFSQFNFQDASCLISRTGYTGELGFEIYIPVSHAMKLWELLLEDPLVKPAGLGSRDTLRLEMGYPLYGQDLDVDHTPIEAGLAKFVDFNKDFIGKNALLEQKKNVQRQYLIYFQADSRRSPRHGFAIFDGENRIGSVTSGSFSPSLSVGIGMGYVNRDYEIGSGLAIKDRDNQFSARVVNKPFLKKTSLRLTKGGSE